MMVVLAGTLLGAVHVQLVSRLCCAQCKCTLVKQAILRVKYRKQECQREGVVLIAAMKQKLDRPREPHQGTSSHTALLVGGQSAVS